MIKKGTDKHINQLPSSPSQNEIQKFSLYRIAYLLRRVLSMGLKKKKKKKKKKHAREKAKKHKYVEYLLSQPSVILGLR